MATMILALMFFAILLLALQAIRAVPLLHSAVWLAAMSAMLAIVFYLLGATYVAVIELSVGAGLVTVASPHHALPMMSPALAEAMWEPLDETADGAIAMSALPRVLELLEGKTALALGPGIGRHPETVAFVKKLVLFHHDPNADDNSITRTLKDTIKRRDVSPPEVHRPEILAAYEGLEIEV